MLKKGTILIVGILLYIRAILGATFVSLDSSKALGSRTLIDGQLPKEEQALLTLSKALLPEDTSFSEIFSKSLLRNPIRGSKVRYVPETWIDSLTEAEVRAINEAFPYLGFGLA
ncbi:MAG: hypothetical protein LBD60_03430 [Puniceicoccales bacterium]|jgi:hypothetical protein|nr:hypothetical protein [Puniceicoccales bacterium]